MSDREDMNPLSTYAKQPLDRLKVLILAANLVEMISTSLIDDVFQRHQGLVEENDKIVLQL